MHSEFDRQKLLDLMRAEYLFVQRTLAHVPPERFAEPNVQGPWSVKDTIAHLAAWQRRTLAWIEAAQRGAGQRGRHPVQPEPGFGWDEFDAINERSFQRDKNRPLPDVLSDFQDSFEQLYAAAQAMTDDELFGRAGLSSFFRDPVWNYIAGNTFHHYQMHIPPLRQWLETLESKSVSQIR